MIALSTYNVDRLRLVITLVVIEGRSPHRL